MRSGTVVLVGATVLLVAASVLFVLMDDSQQTQGTGELVESPAADARAGMDAPAPVPRVGADEVRELGVPSMDAAGHAKPATADDVAATAPTRLTGRVTYELDGRPAAGEHLTVLWEPADPEAERLAHPETSETAVTRADVRNALQTLEAGAFETTTDTDGRYSFTVPDVIRTTVHLSGIEVSASPTTPRQLISEARDLTPGTEAVFDFTLMSGSVLSGTVVDTTGRPVAGATVEGRTVIYGARQTTNDTPDRTVSADGAGAFTMGSLGEEVMLSARADGMAPHVRIDGRFPLGEVTEGLQLMVSEARDVVGIVVDGGGAPLPGVTVRFSSEVPTSQRVTAHEGVFGTGPPPRTAVTGPGGGFRIEGLCQRTYRVRADHEDFQEWNGTHAPEDGQLIIQLTAGLRLTGTVRNLAGTPLPGARIRMGFVALEMAGNNGFTDADEDGRFSFVGLTQDLDAFVVALAQGYAVHAEQPVVLEEGATNHVDIVLRPQHPLAGIVVDARGSPMEGVSLRIEGDRLIDYDEMTIFPKPTWESQFGSLAASTDADGAFRFANLYDGLFRLEAVSPDDDVRTVVNVHSGREDVRLVLDPDAVVGVTLTGVARDGVTGLPIREKFQVCPSRASGGGYSGTSYSFEDEQGRYRISALAEGSMLLNASAPGYAPWSGGGHTLENGEHRFDIAFLPNRRVTFRVVDGNGEPASVNLSFTDEQGASVMVEHGPYSRTSILTTDAKGEAIAGGLPAARITVSAKRGWLGSRQEYTVDLRAELRGPIELVYGEPELRSLLVLVLTGTPSEPEPVGTPGWQIGRWLETQVKEGHLRPVGVPVQVTAVDEDGAQVASTLLDPSGENAQAFPIEGVNTPFVTKLELPARPLTIEAVAEGLTMTPRAWSPDTTTEIMVMVLTPQ